MDIDGLAKELARKIKSELHFNKWLTMDEACEYAKVHRDTLLKWIDEGDIYGAKIGGMWRIDRETIDTFFNCERA